MHQPWRQIVIFRQGRIGDTLVAFPLIESLHDLYPETRLVYCTQHKPLDEHLQGYQVIGMSPFVSEVITYDFSDHPINIFFKLKARLKVDSRDLLLYLPYNRVERYQIVRDWLFFRALGFKNAACFREAWRWTNLRRTRGLQLPREAERLLAFVRSAGIPVAYKGACALKLDETFAEAKWREWALDGKQILAICPGSRMQSKQWPAERYIQLGIEWHRRTNMALVVVGGANEADLATHIVSRWNGYGFSACGATLSQTAAVLSRAKAYCGNDTGCMHLAAIMGVRCVAIFSARDVKGLWYPMGNGHVVIQEDVECRSCQLETCLHFPPPCLDAVQVPRVLKELEEIFLDECHLSN